MEKYQSIIDKPYQKSTARPHMSLNDRAAQFAPFAALTGYEAELKEVSRLTEEKCELTDEAKELINTKLNYIITFKLQEEILVTHFVQDLKKQGGSYKTVFLQVKRIDEVTKELIFVDKTKIKLENIINVNSKTLDSIFKDF
ncbi:MAG: hypothetical protein IJX78_02015 [Bacilli bacterium]|nr:hypothetical protein [Bacilli bacterium]